MIKFIPYSDVLNSDDYTSRTFTFDDVLYLKIINEREKMGLPISSDYTLVFDKRTGYCINGEKIDTKKHEYHDYWLFDYIKNERNHIDIVTITSYFGKYVILTYRKENSNSHGQIEFENINCHHPRIIESIKRNKQRFKLIKK